MIFAVDVDAAGQLLRAGLMTCPTCGARLRVWTSARPRRVQDGEGRWVELTPDRGLCRGCAATHVVLPAWYVPRRAYTAEVIGTVLVAGAQANPRQTIAQRLGLPIATVASWLTSARTAVTSLIRHAHTVAHGAVGEHRSTASWLRNDLAEALDALGDAARAFARGPVRPPPPHPVAPGHSGIDYLSLLDTQHHRNLRRQLHVAAPDGPLPRLAPWHVINLITARRGLLTPTTG